MQRRSPGCITDTRTPMFGEVIAGFETLFREDRGVRLPRREAEALAKEFFIRRLRAGPATEGVPFAFDERELP